MVKNVSGKFTDHFSQVSHAYAQSRPHYPASLFDYLMGLVPKERVTSRAALVWDCACGSGQASFDLASRFPLVVATDASSQQIEEARQQVKPWQNLHPTANPPQFRVATAYQSDLADHSVDLVLVAQAAHWFSLPEFYQEVRRVLRPGGWLVLTAYGRLNFAHEAEHPILAYIMDGMLGAFWPPGRELVEGHYRDLYFPFVEANDSPSLVMEISWDRHQLLGYMRSWSAMNAWQKAQAWRYSQERAKNGWAIGPFVRALNSIWPENEADKPRLIHWPLTLKVTNLTPK